MQRDITLSSDYSRALGWGLLIVLVLLVLSGLFLDGGLTAQITLMAVLAYLGGIAVIVVRRPRNPTKTDLRLIRWGFGFLWLAAQVVVRQAWTWLGRM